MAALTVAAMDPRQDAEPPGFRAVIFDMDGVVTRTARLHAAAWEETFDAFLAERQAAPGEPAVRPFDAAADYRAYVDGKPRAAGVRSFLAARGIELPVGDPGDPPEAHTVQGLAKRKDTLFARRLQRQGVEVFDSTLALIRALREAGVKIGVVTSSRHGREVLHAAGIAERFDVRVDGIDAAQQRLRGKPDPDAFLACAEAIGVSPARAVVVEDAVAGVEAGRRGGFGLVVGIDRGGNREALAAHGADLVVGDHIRGVVGPDEYHHSIDDNAYANWMARFNLQQAAWAAGWLQEHDPRAWAALIDLIEQKPPSLLVLGWHGRFVTGHAQVVKRILQRSTSPVLLVKAEASAPFKLKVGDEIQSPREIAMPTNPLLELHTLGQSVWLDYIRRAMLEDGTLARLIREDGLAGITSNPAIFHKAIAEHDDYDRAIEPLVRGGATAQEIYETLAVEDIQHAADLLLDLYERSEGRDGFVSLEVSPRLAHDTERTLAEARRLWMSVDRPNLMIKVPATQAGLPAIRHLIAEGLNINVTLLFSVNRYAEVAEAYLAGLEERARAGQPVERIASVASFFLSRIDTLVDRRLDAGHLPELRGRAAIACARLAYQHYREVVTGARWQRLANRGARVQRLLWASTSTKDPAYDELKYVEALIAPDTVNTMPPQTLEAYRAHGHPAVRIEDELEQARTLGDRLAEAGIDLEEVAEDLEREGVRKFVEPFEQLLEALERRRRTSRT